MNRTTISVVIPTHNRPDSLARAIKSIEEQTRAPDEIIVVDDGSAPPVDPSAFEDSTSNVHVVRNAEAKGVAAARNIGVRRATGDFVAFLDDDDTWRPTKLKFVEACLESSPNVDVVIHQTGNHMSASQHDDECSAIADPTKRMTRSQPPHIDGVAVRRTVHLDRPFDDELPAAEDLDYLIGLATSGASMVESSAVLAVFREDEPSAIGMALRIEGRLALLERHPEILADDVAAAFFYVRLGRIQQLGGRQSSAIRSYAKSIRLEPTSLVAWKGLARTAMPAKYR